MLEAPETSLTDECAQAICLSHGPNLCATRCVVCLDEANAVFERLERLGYDLVRQTHWTFNDQPSITPAEEQP